MKHFGEWLIAQRNLKNWRQEDLADRLKVSKRTIGGWERGEFTPHRTTLERLASLLGIFPEPLIRAVIDGKGSLPPLEAPPQPLTISVELSTTIRDLASRSGMDVETWIARAVEFFAVQREAMYRELRPAETSQMIARLSGTHGMRIAAADHAPDNKPKK